MTSQVTYVSSVEDRYKRSKLNNVIQSLHCFVSNTTPDIVEQDFGLIDYCGPICKGQLIKGNQPAKKAGTPITAMGVYLGDINKDGVLQVTNTQSLTWSQSVNTTITTTCGYCDIHLLFDPSGSGSSCYCVTDHGHTVDYACTRSCCICPGYEGASSICYVCIREVWTCRYTKSVLDCCVFCDVYRGDPSVECGGWVTDGSHQVSLGRTQHLGPSMYVDCWSNEGLDRALYDSTYYKADGTANECCIAAGIIEPQFSGPSRNAACATVIGIGPFRDCVGPEIMCAFASVSLDNCCPVVNEWLWCNGKLCYHQKCNFGLQWYYYRYFSDMGSGSSSGLSMTVNHMGNSMIRNVTSLDVTRGPFLCDECFANGRWQFRCSPNNVKSTYTNTIGSWAYSGSDDCCKNVWGYSKIGPEATAAIFGSEKYSSDFSAYGSFYFCRPSDAISNTSKACLCASSTGNITLCASSTCYCTVVCTKITCICTCTWDFSCNICINERYF